MKNVDDNLVYVLSYQVGDVGGAAKATRLLCDAYVRLGKKVRLFLTLPPEAETLAYLHARNIKVEVPRLNKGWRHNLPQKQIAFQLFQSAQREKPSWVHCMSLALEARYVLQLPRISRVFLWETTEALPHIKFVDKTIIKHLNKVSGILAPSDTVTRNIRSTYCYEGPIARLPFWCEEPTEMLPPTNTGSGHFLYVGRMDVDKGFEYLFEAFRSVRQQHATARLTVCGGGDIDTIESLAQGIAGIEIRGYIQNDEYERVLATCDAFVLASLHEGYPLSLLEACARGKPIIATRVGSIPEVFENHPCALLVPPHDADALASAMLQLMGNCEEYRLRCADAKSLFDAVSSPQAIEESLKRAFGI